MGSVRFMALASRETSTLNASVRQVYNCQFTLPLAADVEQRIPLVARERRLITHSRVVAGGELQCSLAAERMALQKFGAELRRFLRQPLKQRGRGLRRDAGLLQHLDRIGIGLGLVLARVAQRDDLLGVRADIARERADQGADSELAD